MRDDSAALMISMPPPSSTPSVSRRLAHPALAADQQRGAEPLMHEGRRGADHLLFLALGEDDAARLPAQAARTRAARRRRSDRAGCATAAGRPPCPRSACARRRSPSPPCATAGGIVGNQPRIERHRDDVVGPVFRPRAIGHGDFVGHVLARQIGERVRRRDLHLHVDGARAHVERAAEDVGKAEHVVDLVRIVGAAGRHDGVGAHGGDLLGGDFRIRIGHGEDDRLRRHHLDHVLGHRALDRQTEEHVGVDQRLLPACAPRS